MASDKAPVMATKIASEDMNTDDHPTYRYLAVALVPGTEGQVAFTNGITEPVYGSLYDGSNAESGEQVSIAVGGGQVLFRFGETLVPGQSVGGSADGELALIESTDYTAIPCGRVVEGAGDGEVGSINMDAVSSPIVKSA
jgi:hypothetical protein